MNDYEKAKRESGNRVIFLLVLIFVTACICLPLALFASATDVFALIF